MSRSPVVSLLVLFCWAGYGAVGEKPIPPEQALPSLETSLQLLALAPAGEAPSLAQSLGLDLEQDRLTVVVEAAELSPADLRALGAEVTGAAPEFQLWEVSVPRVGLLGLAELPGVRFVRRPYPARPTVISEGVSLTGARDWHLQGRSGAGIRVAVIDLEFGGLSAAISAGELTHVIATVDYTGTGMETGGVHGTACAEIVQDMAPEAELILMKISNEVDLANAVSYALGLGVKVISHSVGWFNTNFYDGAGVICDIVRTATDAGVLWVNSAGNYAAGSHWEGPWRDADANGVLDFSPGMEFNTFFLPAGTPFAVWLTWADWPTSDQDYDLYLFNMATMEVVASSTGFQTGTQPPAEALFYVPPNDGMFGLEIVAYDAPAAPPLELFCAPNGVDLSTPVAASSIPAPGNATHVLTVGAISWQHWSTGPQEPFSSQGPTNLGEIKPDLCAPDGVSTLSYGAKAFLGTSAAAPHVAGAAALAWSTNSTWDAGQVRSYLESNAVDMGVAGRDNVFGAGRLRLSTPGGGPPPPPTPGGRSHTYLAGWNLASIPVMPADASPEAVWGDDLPRVVVWQWAPCENEYVVPIRLSPGLGHWLWIPVGGATVDVDGGEVVSDITVDLPCLGWNMVSAPWNYPRSAIQITKGTQTKTWDQAVAAGWIGDVLWGYTPGSGYSLATVMDPWQGYWLLTRVDGLTMTLRYADRTSGAAPELAPRAVPEGAPVPPAPPAPETAAGELVVANFPNPVTDVNTTVFRVLGPMAAMVEEIRVRIFDLSGRLVYEGTAAGAELVWHTDDLAGWYLANGVYLYQVQVKVAGNWITTNLKKLAILR